MLRSTLLKSFAAASLAMGLAFAPVEASDELNSSMTAWCVGAGGSCDIVEFELQIFGPEPTYYMKDIQIEGVLGSWEFGAVNNVWSAGNPVTWSANVSGDDLILSLDNDVPWDAAPIRVQVTMSQSGSMDDLMAIYYTANGYTSPNSISQGFFSTSGNVTTVSEPITAAILGAGLLGLLGVGRRREGHLETEEDVA